MRHMTRILAALLLAALAAAMACGRRGSDVVTVSALLEAESLLEDNSDETGDAKRMLHNADSALCVLRAVDTAALATDGDRALYALLLTQALYKQPNPHNLDTLPIQKAVTYYAATAPGSQRHVHALTYAGAAAETNGDISDALYMYKMAELWSDSSQHYDIGYAEMKIANIYHVYTIEYAITINYYQKAIAQYEKAGKGMFWLYCISDLGGIYRMTSHQDSALFYLTMAHDAAVERQDSFMITDTEVYLTGYYYHIKDYRKALEYAKMIGKRPGKFDLYPLVPLFAASSSAKLHQPDSAELFLKEAKLSNYVDSAGYFEALSYIAAERGDSIGAKQYMSQANYFNDNHIIRQSKKISTNAESPAVIDRLELDKRELHATTSHRIFIVIVLSITVAAFVLYVIRRSSKSKVSSLEEQLSQLKASFALATDRLQQTKTRLEEISGNNAVMLDAVEAAEHLCSMLNAQYDMLRSSVESTFVSKGGKSRNNNLNDYRANDKMVVPEKFWVTMAELVDALYPGAVDDARQTLPDMAEGDYHFLLLKCMRFPDAIVCILTGMTNVRSVDNKTQRLKRDLCPTMTFDQWLQCHSAMNRIHQ